MTVNKYNIIIIMNFKKIKPFIYPTIYLILGGIFIVLFTHYFIQNQLYVQEGIRTLPREVRYPEENDNENGNNNDSDNYWAYYFLSFFAVKNKDINAEINSIINKLFDTNNNPTSAGRQLYKTYLVGQVITQISKKQLEDMLYYCIECVIPNIPTSSTENAPIWQNMKWIKTGDFSKYPTQNIYPGVKSDLNDKISFGVALFDNNGNLSNNAQNIFKDYISKRGFIDNDHKNKLTDITYYIIENILPIISTDNNLPTKMPSNMKPIRWITTTYSI